MVTDRVVIDASAGVRASLTDRWQALDQWHLVAPSLFWSEGTAGIRQLAYRGEISDREASEAVARLITARVESVPSRDLAVDALQLAQDLGWAKTYDAEFVTLARRLDAPLLTVDARLASTAGRLVRLLTEHP